MGTVVWLTVVPQRGVSMDEHSEITGPVKLNTLGGQYKLRPKYLIARGRVCR